MDLAALMQRLIDEEGLSEEEALALATATMKARRRKQELQRSHSESVQQHPRRVDYGFETPAQAKERWVEQERADPNGLFGGGATAGGVFGDAPIALDSFDPLAVSREVQLRTQMAGIHTQREMLELLQDMRQELRQGRRERRQLESRSDPSFTRRLGKKKT